jgi:hypothetical protein
VSGNTITLGFENSFYLDLTRPLQRDVEAAMALHLGVSEVRLELTVVDAAGSLSPQVPGPDEELSEMREFQRSDNVSAEETVATMIERVFPGAREIE